MKRFREFRCRGLTRPTTGIVGCCARAASGHAAAAPPNSVMNWRRLISNKGLPSPPVPMIPPNAQSVCRRLGYRGMAGRSLGLP